MLTTGAYGVETSLKTQQKLHTASRRSPTQGPLDGANISLRHAIYAWCFLLYPHIPVLFCSTGGKLYCRHPSGSCPSDPTERRCLCAGGRQRDRDACFGTCTPFRGKGLLPPPEGFRGLPVCRVWCTIIVEVYPKEFDLMHGLSIGVHRRTGVDKQCEKW